MMHKESHSPVDPAGGFFNVKEFIREQGMETSQLFAKKSFQAVAIKRYKASIEG
jgi:hypothetical protein